MNSSLIVNQAKINRMANKYVFVFLTLMVLVTVVSIGEAVRFAPGAIPVSIRFRPYGRPYGKPYGRPFGRPYGR